MDIEELIRTVIDCAYQVRLHLSSGFLENVYRNALLLELDERGIRAEKEKLITVYYKNTVVGEYRADIVVDDRIIIELKSVQHLNVIHETQLVNYLTATGIDDGLLINFGGERIEVKRKYRHYRKT